jgi:hypothetical protein
MKVAAPAPQTSGRLSKVYPNMPELLAVTALCKAVLSTVALDPDCYMAKGCQAKDFLRLSRSWQGMRNRGRFLGKDPSDGDLVFVICLALIM